jgi:lipoate-protein ligase A
MSLGYFQPAAVREQDQRLLNLPFVRRLTGGDAIVHHFELTYALALPAVAAGRGSAWIERMHGIIAVALAKLGVTSQLHKPSSASGFSGALCFQHVTACDVVLNPGTNAAGSPRKVVGSAQRRRRGALLQHGSILLGTSPFAPQVAGIRELGGQVVSALQICDALVGELRAQWLLEPIAWTQQEQGRVGELALSKYGQEMWNGKR